MDPRPSNDTDPTEAASAHAVLAEVTCTWEREPASTTSAVVVHAAHDMLILEASDPSAPMPPLGTVVHVESHTETRTGRLAEHGRGGRFLVSLGERPVRRSLRLRVSLPATLRGPSVTEPRLVELADLTTGGARVRGLELPVDSQITLDFTPPGRDQPVTVRASVAHSTHGAKQPWVGVAFRLVALRGGR